MDRSNYGVVEFRNVVHPLRMLRAGHVLLN